jgi:hypothetical protein
MLKKAIGGFTFIHRQQHDPLAPSQWLMEHSSPIEESGFSKPTCRRARAVRCWYANLLLPVGSDPRANNNRRSHHHRNGQEAN